MSSETLQAIGEAIHKHVCATHQRSENDLVLSDWFVAYGGMVSSSVAPDGIAYLTGYAGGEGSPQGTYGVARMGIDELRDHLMGFCEQEKGTAP